MSLRLFTSGTERAVTFTRFPAGETLVRIGDVGDRDCFASVIRMDFEGNGDLIDLLLLTDAVRRKWPTAIIDLVAKYLPYARQDRVCNPGESLSVKVIADLINSQNYSKVTCLDLHSDVPGALIDRLHHIEMWDSATLRGCAHGAAEACRGAILVSPDAGANKKVFKFAQVHGFKDVVRADKVRDVATGKILDTKVFSEHVGDRDFLILDDICDGGRTFIELAKKLRLLTTGKIYLYVTHGIFSNGSDTVAEHFDRIFTANLMGNTHPSIVELK